MNTLLKNQIFKELARLLKSSDECTYTHRLTGRIFDVRSLNNSTYFVAEYLPSNQSLRHAIKGNPNNSLAIFNEAGIDIETLGRFIGGFGAGTLYHASLADAARVIADAIETNTVVKHALTPEERAEKIGEIGLAQKAVREAEMSVRYWHEETKAGSTNSGIFNGTSSMLGDLSKSTKDSILSFLNNPSENTWNECYSFSVIGHRTLWQIWCANDPSAPRGLSEEGEWPSFPAPQELIKWIEKSVKEAKLTAHDRLEQAKIKLSEARVNLEKLTGAERNDDSSFSL